MHTVLYKIHFERIHNLTYRQRSDIHLYKRKTLYANLCNILNRHFCCFFPAKIEKLHLLAELIYYSKNFLWIL